MSVSVTCIRKDKGNHENPYVAINSFGWINESTGAKGSSTREQMYDWVLGGGYGYVKDPKGNTARLIASVTQTGTRYVKTVPDNVLSDNLLKLPECI